MTEKGCNSAQDAFYGFILVKKGKDITESVKALYNLF